MKMIQNILVLDRQKMTEVAFVVMAIISFMPYQARTPHYNYVEAFSTRQ